MQPDHDFTLVNYVIRDADTGQITQTGVTQKIVFDSLKRQGLIILRADEDMDTGQLLMDFED